MKKTITALIFCLLLFNSCEEIVENSRVTVYVSNAGEARKWAYISAEIGGQTESFFTPENRDIALECYSNSSNAAYFDLPPGNYTYKVTDGFIVWSNSFTLRKNQCYIIELVY